MQEALVIIITLGFIYLLLKPSKKPKSKEQKQKEIIQDYKNLLDAKLSNIEDKEEFLEKKTALLKKISLELHRNLFFDEVEAKEIIRELVDYRTYTS